jgi:adenine-specific DNA-methyltransferase
MADHIFIAGPALPYLSSAEAAEGPAEYASRLYTRYVTQAAKIDRRDFGQFFTPLAVARMMAKLATDSNAESLRVLEPGAGTAILASAFCEALPASVRQVHIDAFEIHPVLADLCEDALGYASRWLEERGVQSTFDVHRKDFVLANAGRLAAELFKEPRAAYDVAISNPPYFKLQKQDPRALAVSDMVHGQPNIYAIFMAIMATLLRDDGIMVTITPRSFTAGDYFKRFREVLFANVVPDAIHLFTSRRDAFRDDEVLQENIIMRARPFAHGKNARVTISKSTGIYDMEKCNVRNVPLASVVDLGSRDLTVHIPTAAVEDDVLKLVRTWPETLESLCLNVSTGPVVAFRASQFLRSECTSDSVPLLWLKHVRQMKITWPASVSKPQHIVSTPESESLLIPNRTYVLMRRFSAKEEHRRIVAAPLFKDDLPGDAIGLENHLNYIYRPKGSVDRDEAIGLAALLSSAVVDCYFRISNGNTQVSAAELRKLPLPSRVVLEKIGLAVRRNGQDLDRIVQNVLHVPTKLRHELERRGNAEG